MVLKFIAGILAALLGWAVLRAIWTGKVSWYSGGNLSATRADEPFSFWFILSLEVVVFIALIWLLI